MKKLLSICACVLLLLTSCRSHKPSGSEPPSSVPGMLPSSAVEAPTPKNLYNSLADSYLKWDNVYMPVTVTLNQPMKISVSGRATLIRGKEVHVSLRMLGFEVAVLYANSDSIYAFEKLHKCYIAESLKDLLRGADITIDDFQALLLGQAFMPGKGVVTEKQRSDFDILVADNSISLTPKKAPAGVDWQYECSTSPLMLKSLAVSTKSAAGECQFSTLCDTPAGCAAKTVDINLQAKGRDLGAQLKWDFNSARWNEKRSINFNIPRGYQRVTASALLNLLKSF